MDIYIRQQSEYRKIYNKQYGTLPKAYDWIAVAV